jgi:hypothetical protein
LFSGAQAAFAASATGAKAVACTIVEGLGNEEVSARAVAVHESAGLVHGLVGCDVQSSGDNSDVLASTELGCVAVTIGDALLSGDLGINLGGCNTALAIGKVTVLAKALGVAEWEGSLDSVIISDACAIIVAHGVVGAHAALLLGGTGAGEDGDLGILLSLGDAALGGGVSSIQ